MSTGHNPLDLQTQEVVRKQLDDEKRLEREQELADLKWLMSTKAGRRFMRRLLANAGVFRISYTGDNNGTNFNEGMRNVGLKQVNDIHAVCPDRYTEMMKEHADELKR